MLNLHFIIEQIKLLPASKKARRFSNELIITAFLRQMTSPSLYKSAHFISYWYSTLLAFKVPSEVEKKFPKSFVVKSVVLLHSNAVTRQKLLIVHVSYGLVKFRNYFQF